MHATALRGSKLVREGSEPMHATALRGSKLVREGSEPILRTFPQ